MLLRLSRVVVSQETFPTHKVNSPSAIGTSTLFVDDMLRLEDENLMLLPRDATRRARVVKAEEGAKLPINRARAISVFIDMVKDGERAEGLSYSPESSAI